MEHEGISRHARTPGRTRSKHHVAFEVYEIAIYSRDTPWDALDKRLRITVIWSNVVAVQDQNAAL